ncbi:transcription initiation factor TFIID subunit 13 isoform X2 [Folsomia candida]|uniref:transcription initiation factor TFIID subunit 13 isoform X2 n=1 Tax=Folsomia candida TaxID=158441 RepID=UPI000B8F4CFF|nr:transcription initiation factor TFIID subunit 13 isoform X2 [Folsomia candida]
MASSGSNTPVTTVQDDAAGDHSSEGHQTEEETELESKPSSDDARKRLFSKELRHMMFGLGDDPNPYTESVDLIEDLVVEYIAETTQRAMDTGRAGRVQSVITVPIIHRSRTFYTSLEKTLENMLASKIC